MFRSIVRKPLNLTATLSSSFYLGLIRRRYSPLTSPFSFSYSRPFFACFDSRWFSEGSGTGNSPPPRGSELTRVSTLLDGCDYEHWLVVMEPPKGYPLRNEIVDGYIKTLAMVLGSEDEAKKSIYSVSTKYYYAFSCKIPENLTCKIKSLPNVRWVLPDSYLCHGENDYGGEPFIDGEVVPYDEKYHADWLRDPNGDKCRNTTSSRKARRKEKKR